MLDQQGGYSARMNAPAPTLEDLVNHLCAYAKTDVQLAKRVAMVCCFLIETKVDPIAAIRTRGQHLKFSWPVDRSAGIQSEDVLTSMAGANAQKLADFFSENSSGRDLDQADLFVSLQAS